MRWEGLSLRRSTRSLLLHMAGRKYGEEVLALVLFGSEARQEANVMSDVDIAVISLEPLSRKQLLATHPHVSLPELADVDYRIINTLANDLNIGDCLNVNYHIRREGVIIYAR